MRPWLHAATLALAAAPMLASPSCVVPRRTLLDAAQGRRYLLAGSCEHPERPWRVVKAESLAESRAGRQDGGRAKSADARQGNTRAESEIVPSSDTGWHRPVVAQGSHVRVMRETASAHVEMAGVALMAGRVGESIAVRVVSGSGEAVLHGTVRGEGSVELTGTSGPGQRTGERW